MAHSDSASHPTPAISAPSDVRFYEDLLAHPHLVEHCPAFLGTQVITRGKVGEGSEEAPEHREGCDVMLCLEDLTARFTKPCICDVKMGNIQHGHDAPPHKAMWHESVEAPSGGVHRSG